MLYARDSLFSMVRRYTPGGNFGVRFLNSTVFSLHLSRDIGHILCDDFSTPNGTFSAIKKSLRNHVGSGDICRTI